MKHTRLVGVVFGVLFTLLLAFMYTQRGYLHFLIPEPAFGAVGTVRVAGSYATFSGSLRATQYIDNDNPAYFIDPNASGNSIVVAGNITAPTFSGAISGNTTTATTLQTARTIWGQTFNGSANVSGALSGATTGSFSSTVTAPTFSGNATSWLGYTSVPTWNQSTTGNAATATNVPWSGVTSAPSVGLSNMIATAGNSMSSAWTLAWKNYANHQIVDMSAGTAPNGTAHSNTNPEVSWVGSYPTLMGWNGTNTFGVRVDSAKTADSADSMLSSFGGGWNMTDATWIRSTPGKTVYMNNGFDTGAASGVGGGGALGGGYMFKVYGSLYAGGSSRDYKTNIEPLTLDPSKIYQLNPVSFDYKPEWSRFNKSLAGGREFGLIAEDVAKVYPELALTLTENGVKKISNVDYEKLSVLLLAEMKNQKKELDSLKQDVENLKERLNQIETKLK